MARTYNDVKNRKKDKDEEEVKVSASSSERRIEQMARKRQEKYIGFDTFESDLNSLGGTLTDIFGGWQTAETMNNTKASIEAMYGRIGAYQDYRTKYGNNSLPDLTELHETYKTALEGWDDQADEYSNYSNADAYNEAIKTAEKMRTDDLEKVQTEISDLETILDTARGYESEIKDLNTRKEQGIARSRGLYSSELIDKDIESATKEYEDYLKNTGYPSADDIRKALGEKKVYYNNAQRVQNRIALSSVGDVNSENYDADYNKYVSLGESVPYTEVGSSRRRITSGKGPKTSSIKTDSRLAAEALDRHIKKRNGDVSQYETVNSSYYSQSAIFDLMTEQEFADLAYYIGKDQEDGGNRTSEYVASIRESLNSRRGQEIAKNLEGQTFSQFAFGIDAGLDQFGSGMKNLLSYKEDYLPSSQIQFASGEVRKDISKEYGVIGQGAYDLVTTASNMAPSILVGTAINLIAPGAGVVSQIASTATMGASAAGNSYQEMLNLGYDKGQARTYSTLVGASEALLQYALGGISKLGGKLTGKTLKALDSIDNAFLKFAAKYEVSKLGEGFEEGLQSFLEPIFMNIAAGYDTGAEVDWGEVVYSGLLGYAMGGVFEGPSLAINSIQEYSGNVATGKDIRSAEQTANVFDMASVSPEASEAYEAYTRYANKGVNAENISNAQLGNLYNKVKSEASGALFEVDSSRSEISKQKEIRESEKSNGIQKRIATTKLDKAISKYTDAQTRLGKYTEAMPKLAEIEGKIFEYKGKQAIKSDAEKMSSGVETSVMADTNKAVDIQGVKIEGKDIKIVTKDGEFAQKDIKLSDKDAELISYAKYKTTPELANLYVNQYDGKTDLDEYSRDFELVTEYAMRSGFTPQYILDHKGSLSTEQVNAIYQDTVIAQARQKEAEHDKLIAATANNTPYTGYIDDHVIKEIGWHKLDKRQRASVEFLKVFATKSGMNLVFTPYSEKTNGGFSIKNNTIYVSAYAGISYSKNKLKDTIIPTASHEITHWMEEKAPELWEKLKNVALDALEVAYKADGKNYTQADLIAAEVTRLNEAHPEKQHTDQDAVREIVARSCEDMLAMSKEGRKMFESMSEAEQKTFIDKVKEIITNLKKWIDELLSSYGTQSDEAELLRNYKDKLEEMSGIWDQMLVRSIDVNQALEKSGVFEHLENGISEDGTTIVGENNLQMSDKTYREGGRDFLVNWLNGQKDLSEADKQNIVEQTDRVAEIMRAIDEGGELPDYSNWANMEVVKDEKGEKMISVIVKNGDYSMNIDFSQVCKKRVALDSVLNAMVQQGVLDVVSLSESDMAELNAIIKEHDFEIACALCFVDAKRYRVNAWADSFCEGSDEKKSGKVTHKYGFNEMVRSLIPEGSKLKVDDFNFTNRDIKNQPTKNLLSEAKDSELDFSLIDKIMAENDSKSAQYRYAKAIKENPEIRKILNSSEIISSIGLDTIRLVSPKLYGLINGHQGTAKPKFAHSMVAYGNDVLKASNFTAEAAKMVGGVRCQSFSDFMASMVVDYAQFVSELAAKKLTSHSYTKEPLFVKLFGLTGMKINMSLVPKAVDMTAEQQKQFAILKDKNANKRSKEYREAKKEYAKLTENAGLDENGNYIWEDETFPYDIAMEIVTDRRYSKNCGTIAVGISHNHIKKLLADDRISMVIPYHKSGLNHEVAMMRDIALYHDYTGVQNTRDRRTGKKLDGVPDFDFYGDLYGKDGKEGTHDPKQTAQNYLSWCYENNYIPKFDDFAIDPNYYKLLIDFRVYDVDGTYAEQQPVQAIYPSNEEFNDLILNGVKDKDGKVYGGLKQQQSTSDRLDAETQQIIDEYKERLKKKHGTDRLMQWSDKDVGYDNKTFDFGVTQKEINSYVKKSYQKENEKSYIKYLEASSDLIEEVSLDVNISGYAHALRDNDIRHIRNSHGENTNEKYPVTQSDIQMIPFVVENYDKVFYKTNANGAPGLVFVKVMPKDVIYYVEAITQEYGKEKLLVNKQMIKTGLNEIPNLVGLIDAINKKESSSQYLADLEKIRKAYAQGVKENYSINRVHDSSEKINEHSVNNEEMQYSDKNTSSVYDVMGETENILRENKMLNEDVARLKKILGTEEVSNSKYLSLANYLKEISGSNIDSAKLGKMLKEAYTSMQKSGTLSWEDVMMNTHQIATSMMTLDLNVSVDYFNRAMLEISKEKISLSEEQRARVEERFGNYGDFHKYVFGRVNVAKDGKPLTEVWKNWSKIYPSLFESDVKGVEQIDALIEAVDILKTTKNKMKDYERAEAIRHLSTVIYNQFWNIATETSSANQAKPYKAEHKKMMVELKQGYEQRQKDLVVHPTGETALKYERALKKAKEYKKKEVAHVKELGRQKMAEYKENVERKSRIQSITANTLTLADWYVTNSKDKHIPEVMKGPVKNLIDAIDFSSKRLLDKNIPTQKDISLAKALNKVRNMMIDASKGNADLVQLYGHNLDEDIQKMMDSIDMMDRTIADNEYILQKMSLEDLATLDKMVKTIKASVSKMNKFHIVNHAKGVASLSQTAMVEMDKLGKAKVYEGLRGKIDKTLMWNNAIPVYAFKRFGEAGTKVFEALQDGWDKFAFNVKKALDFAKKTYTSKEVEEWEATVKTFDIRVPATEDDLANPDYKPQFQKVQMTIPQIMSLHCLYKREQAKQHLIGGGIRVADFTVGKKVVSQPDGLVFTKENVETIISTLSKRQVEVADKIQEFMNTVCSEWGNEVSMARFGIRQFGEANYFPIQSDKNNLAVDDETEKANSLFRLLNMSFSKSLTPGANNRIVISNIFDVFAQHSSDMAKYNALALPVLDTFRWYNYTEKHEVGDDAIKTNGVKQAMEKAFGSDGKSYFTTFLKDINGQKEVSRDTLGAGLFTNAKIASVGANLRVVFLQPTSYVRASAIIDNKYLTKALMFKPKTDKAQEHCGIAQWKALGYYDTNIQKGVADQIKGVKTWKDKAQEWSMWGAEKADSLTWGYLWNACELEIRDTRKDLKVGSKEFYDAISKRLREVIYATQVVDSTMTRSQMMRSGQLYDKMLTAFASEPTLAYNMVVDAYVQLSLDKRRMSKGEAWRKNRTHIARVASAYIMTNAVAALVESAFDAYRDDDDEEKDLVYFMKTYLSNFAQDMSLVGKIPYIKDMVSIFQGYGASRTDIAWMESLYKALTGTWKLFTSDSGNPGKVAKNWIKFVSSTKGLPLYNIYRDTKLEKLISEMFEENS